MKLACIVVLSVLFASAAATGAAVVGWTPIKNISDPHVSDIANYAVTEHNKLSGQKLKLEKVIKGDTQVVAGINYRLFLTALDASSAGNYKAVVWEKAWLHFRNLTSFTPIRG